jgi:hypothetical protein
LAGKTGRAGGPHNRARRGRQRIIAGNPAARAGIGAAGAAPAHWNASQVLAIRRRLPQSCAVALSSRLSPHDRFR